MPITSVIRKSGKYVFLVLTATALLIALLLAVFRFFPGAYITLINKTTPYDIASTHLKTQLLPASIEFTELSVTHSQAGQTANRVATASSLLAQVDWVGVLSDKHNFWYAELDGADVYLNSIVTQTSTSETKEKTETSKPLNIHWLLSLLNMKVSNTSIVLNDSTHLRISELNTDVGEKENQQASQIKQNIQLSGNYQENNKSLVITGTLRSEYHAGRSEITLDLGDIDLTAIMDASEDKPANPGDSRSAEVDWTWMQLIEPTRVVLNVNTVVLGDGRAESLNLVSEINNSLNIESLQAKLNWPLSDALWFSDTISIQGYLRPEKDNLLDTKVSLAATQSEWEFKGLVDLTQILNSRGQLNFSAKTLPLSDKDGNLSRLLTENSQWFPLSSSLNASPSPQDQAIPSIKIELGALKAGKSDLSGSVNLTGLDNTREAPTAIGIQATLASNLLRYQTQEGSPKDGANRTPVNDSTKSKSRSKQRVFSKETIDWAWLSSVQLDANINIKELSVDERTLYNLKLPVSLSEDGLVIQNADAELGDGAMRASLEILPIASQSNSEFINLSLEAKASGIVLNDLKLVDEETLKGGDSRLTLSLSSSGASAYELASNLSGDALFHMRKAVIGNDAFELIGSDLIAELISKLNPFLKSDPTTDLKCAVVNLDIDQGKVEIDKSIALETSKMIIVADGNIDLEKETIKLGIKPQSTSGIGLDAGSLVKFLELGGTLSNPKPVVGADGLLKSGVAVGAALSTGGASLLLDGLVSKMASGKACERALNSNARKD